MSTEINPGERYTSVKYRNPFRDKHYDTVKVTRVLDGWVEYDIQDTATARAYRFMSSGPVLVQHTIKKFIREYPYKVEGS